MAKAVDSVTRKWCRNRADELAAKAGYRFDPKRGQFMCDWILEYCVLTEGVAPDTPLVLLDWHRDTLMRLFSWVKYSDFWKCDVRRFDRGGIWTPKKNAKSVLLWFIELYMMVGDGEHRQQCYLAAKDGTQARRTQEHLLESIRASPKLAPLFEINKTKGTALHIASRSVASVVAGDNKDSQQGLNGSCFIDEAHVCDAELMSILRYMGATRKEPLQLCVSTAGNNPSGWGKSQWDYGRLVNKGEIPDAGYFHIDYALPDDVKVSEIEKKLVFYGKMANPAWGTLVNPEKFKAEFFEAKRSKSAMADFLMYKLNRWQKACNPWLASDAWEECATTQEAVTAVMESEPVYGGLDLGQVNDPCAFAMCAVKDGVTYFDVIVWMTQKWAEDHVTEEFLQWAKSGHLRLMPGNSADYGFIKRDIVALAKTRKIREIAYDPMFADYLTQQLQKGTPTLEGIGCQRIAFPQTNASFSKPTADFENALMARTIRHTNNPVLNWMASHVEARTDAYGNKRPVKPDDDDKKIDGIVAACMARAAATAPHYEPSLSVV